MALASTMYSPRCRKGAPGRVRRRRQEKMALASSMYSPRCRKGAPGRVRRRRQEKMALASSMYRLLFRRTSTFALTIVVGAVVFERVFDQGADALFEHLNRGKLWKHIKHKYEQPEE
ncbi:cytochrome b-c1 complex subunit 9 [Rhinatrema bivittatum]|uniref:cytochrome b-c1 complex subunit 9 n=1 Tax=Rhinatrema bivittatum TaxID=194408 RepID=UPI00112DE3D0|nr:cytochrome b-c1 complex subunit 9 [Rhinatrema bivittatum]